jgi:hypothetical protein
MYAGALSYFSSGSLGRGLGVSVCPKTVGSATREPKQASKVVAPKNNEEKIHRNCDDVNVRPGCATTGVAIVSAFSDHSKTIPAFQKNVKRVIPIR